MQEADTTTDITVQRGQPTHGEKLEGADLNRPSRITTSLAWLQATSSAAWYPEAKYEGIGNFDLAGSG
jgi:hypothetical protein